MSKFQQKVLNVESKQLTKGNRNYFYLSTLIIIGLLCLCQFALQNQINNLVESNNLWNMLFMPLRHAVLADFIANVVLFFLVSLLLERHFGSLKYFALVILTFIPSSLTTFAFELSWTFVGFGGVLFFLLAIALCVIIFNFKDYFCGKVRWIFPILLIALFAVAACIDLEATLQSGNSVVFGAFINVVKEPSSWGCLVCGTAVGLLIQLGKFRRKTVETKIDLAASLKSNKILRKAKVKRAK